MVFASGFPADGAERSDSGVTLAARTEILEPRQFSSAIFIGPARPRLDFFPARDLVNAITADLGGDLSAAQSELVQRAALLGAFLSDCEARWLAGDDVRLACDRQRRVLQSLGLRRVPKPVPDLQTYLREKYGEAA